MGKVFEGVLEGKGRKFAIVVSRSTRRCR